MIADSFLAAFAAIFLVLHVWQSILWNRERKVWVSERARLLDAALARNAGDFRVRQTTAPALWDEADSEPLVARPNKRLPHPVAIGLDGGAF